MSLSYGPNLGILIAGNAGEAHHAAILEFFRWIDALVQPHIADKDLATPPGSPADGDLYIVAGSPTGAWSTHAGHLARWWAAGSAWEFRTPKTGWRVHVIDEAIDYRWSGSAWVALT